MRILILLAIVAVVMYGGPAMAFHDGGVAECAGCHTMHKSQDGVYVDPAHPAGNAYLLNNGNASDTCLRCHAAYGQFAGGFGHGAGGDFYWLTKTYTWSSHGRPFSSEGDSHGHNIISPAYGLTQDVTLSAAPGGSHCSNPQFPPPKSFCLLRPHNSFFPCRCFLQRRAVASPGTKVCTPRQ